MRRRSSKKSFKRSVKNQKRKSKKFNSYRVARGGIRL